MNAGTRALLVSYLTAMDALSTPTRVDPKCEVEETRAPLVSALSAPSSPKTDPRVVEVDSEWETAHLASVAEVNAWQRNERRARAKEEKVLHQAKKALRRARHKAKKAYKAHLKAEAERIRTTSPVSSPIPSSITGVLQGQIVPLQLPGSISEALARVSK